jgi:uroporphyrinogen decarboxylase
MAAMTPRERWSAVLQRQKPDRLPMDYWGTPETSAKLMQHLACATEWEVFERLHIDRMVQLNPRYIGPPLKAGYDIWGLRYESMDYGTGAYAECVEHPLANYSTVEEIDANYRWPTPDYFDYSRLPEQIVGREDYPVQGGGSEPFLIYKDLRGHEQAYMDLVLNPEILTYCLDKLFAFAYQNTTRIYEALPGRVDFSYIAEDFGGQERLLFSADIIRSIFIPRMKRMMDLAHENGTRVFFHSDGSIRDIIPDLIAAGIDILNPLQWRCTGMERAELKRDFGAQVVLHGGVDNQYTLAFGSVEEVSREVCENIDVLGADGGYILAPCHNIQAVSPVENIVAMYETGYRYGQTGG